MTVKFWTGTIGILLPLLAGLWNVSKERKRASVRLSAPPSSLYDLPMGKTVPPLWLWCLFVCGAGWSHFYRLTSVPAWPIGDEGTFATIAMGLQRHWSWKLLLGEAQWEPLFAWMLSWFFRAVTPSLPALRLFPDFLALAVVACAYWAFSPLGNRWFAFAGAWVMAFSFWPFTYSRLCVREGLLLLWMFAAFGLALRISPRKGSLFFPRIFLLAAVLGSGFYVFTTWPQAALMAILLVSAKINRRHGTAGEKTTAYFLLILPMALLASPMIGERLAEGGMSHVGAIFNPSDFPLQACRYTASLFWYGFQSAPWGPAWGGLFNPVLGSLFFLGILYTVRRAPTPEMVFMLLSFPFFLSAAALSGGGFSPYRMTALLPLSVLFLVWGLKGLLEDSAPRLALLVFLLVGTSSMALDFHHYSGFYSKTAGSPEYAHAYRVLNGLARRTGPIDVFTDFSTDYDDKTLSLAVYPFNALQNPRWGQVRPQWAALVVNLRYVPYFQSEVPGLQYEALGVNDGRGMEATTLGLVLMPTALIPKGMLDRWIQANQLYQAVDWQIKNKTPWEPWGDIPMLFAGLQEKFPQDPFLTSVYWEKYAFFKLLGKDYPAAADAYSNAVRKGYPAEHLYYQWGMTLRALGKTDEARQALGKAGALTGKVEN